MNRLKYSMSSLFSFALLFSLLSCGSMGGLDRDSDGAESNQLQSEEDCQAACREKDDDREIRACQASCSSQERDETDRERGEECEDGEKASREETWYICKDGSWYAYDGEKDEAKKCESGEQAEKDGMTYICDHDGKWQ